MTNMEKERGRERGIETENMFARLSKAKCVLWLQAAGYASPGECRQSATRTTQHQQQSQQQHPSSRQSWQEAAAQLSKTTTKNEKICRNETENIWKLCIFLLYSLKHAREHMPDIVLGENFVHKVGEGTMPSGI